MGVVYVLTFRLENDDSVEIRGIFITMAEAQSGESDWQEMPNEKRWCSGNYQVDEILIGKPVQVFL